MTAVRLDGLATAKAIKAEIAERVIHLKQKGITPGLGTLLVGDDPGSHSYVSGKHRDCAEVGIHSIRIDMPADSSVDDIRSAIRDFNEDKEVTGYIIQLPLRDINNPSGRPTVTPRPITATSAPCIGTS